MCGSGKSDGWLQERGVDKIYSFNFVAKPEIYQMFIAGAGPTAVLKKAYVDVHESLENAAIAGNDGKGETVDIAADQGIARVSPEIRYMTDT